MLSDSENAGRFQQYAEHPAEPLGGRVDDHLRQRRSAQHGRMQLIPHLWRAYVGDQADEARHQHDAGDQTRPRLHEVGDGDEHAGRQRQLGVEVLEGIFANFGMTNTTIMPLTRIATVNRMSG